MDEHVAPGNSLSFPFDAHTGHGVTAFLGAIVPCFRCFFFFFTNNIDSADKSTALIHTHTHTAVFIIELRAGRVDVSLPARLVMNNPEYVLTLKPSSQTRVACNGFQVGVFFVVFFFSLQAS